MALLAMTAIIELAADMDRSVKLTLAITIAVFIGGLILLHQECEAKGTCGKAGRKSVSSVLQQGVTPP